MGTDAAYEEGVEKIPPHVGMQADGTAVVKGAGQRLGLPPYGGCDGGDGVEVFGDLRLPSPERSSTIYCN